MEKQQDGWTCGFHMLQWVEELMTSKGVWKKHGPDLEYKTEEIVKKWKKKLTALQTAQQQIPDSSAKKRVAGRAQNKKELKETKLSPLEHQKSQKKESEEEGVQERKKRKRKRYHKKG